MLKENTACSDSRYAVLFESVKIGPVTAPNRFYRTPHCNGMGHLRPQALAAMRGIKAEGGWGVVSTEETEIHPSSDVSPYAEGRLWSDDDIPAHALVRNPFTDTAANVALSGQRLLSEGARVVFSLCRPPGHHAPKDMFGVQKIL